MWIVFDLIVIAIIALCTFIGYKQGLVKAAIKILSFFIAIIIALVLYKPISNVVVNNTSVDENIKNTIIDKINPEEIDKNKETEEAGHSINDFYDYIKNLPQGRYKIINGQIVKIE